MPKPVTRFRNRAFPLSLLAAPFLALTALPAAAHSFQTVIMPAESQSVEEWVVRFREGFLLASEERDSHAAQESDGHLGGVDVYLNDLLPSEDIDGFAPPPEIAILPDPGAQLPGGWDKTASMVLPATEEGRITPRDQAYLDRAAEAALAPFARRFEERTGRSPGPVETAGYLAGRRIDEALREAGGATDFAALQKALSALADTPPAAGEAAPTR